MSNQEITAIAKKSREYYLLFSFPIQIAAIVSLALLPLDYAKVSAWTAIFYVVIYWQGIQNGAHKLFSHKSWEPRWSWIKYATAYLSCFGLMGGPITWSNLHRWHHAHSDEERDPHSPRHGVFHSYVGWLMNPPAIPFMVVRDLMRDDIIVWINQRCREVVAVTLIVVAIIDYQVAVALAVAMTITFNFEMAVNAFLHREVNGKWAAVNNAWLAIPTGGSSLHANHHKSPGKYSFAKYWYEIDLSALLVRLLKK